VRRRGRGRAGGAGHVGRLAPPGPEGDQVALAQRCRIVDRSSASRIGSKVIIHPRLTCSVVYGLMSTIHQ
jgi:hypothetical protein